MEEIGRMLNSALRITAEDDEVICVDDILVEEGKAGFGYGLVGKLLTTRPFNIRSLRSVMMGLWKPGPGFRMQELSRDVFSFSFGSEADRQFVLDREPWLFDKSLLALMRIEDYDRGMNNFHSVSIWIHMYNIPLYARTEKIAKVIGNKIGVCSEVVSDLDGRCWGTFVRARICLLITQPLKRRIKVKLGKEAAPFWVDVKYERLPDFCFICGLIGHVSKDCSTPVEEDWRKPEGYRYGNWLRAPNNSLGEQRGTHFTSGVKGVKTKHPNVSLEKVGMCREDQTSSDNGLTPKEGPRSDESTDPLKASRNRESNICQEEHSKTKAVGASTRHNWKKAARRLSDSEPGGASTSHLGSHSAPTVSLKRKDTDTLAAEGKMRRVMSDLTNILGSADATMASDRTQ
jgi:hypothetical protein